MRLLSDNKLYHSSKWVGEILLGMTSEEEME